MSHLQRHGKRHQRRISFSPRIINACRTEQISAAESEHGRVQIAQKPEAERRVFLDQVFDLRQIQFGFQNRVQNGEVNGSICRACPGAHHLRSAEEIPLHQLEPRFFGELEVLPRLDLHGDHPADSTVTGDDKPGIGEGGLPQIDFDEIRKIGQRLPRIVDHVIVERDLDPGSFQLRQASITSSSGGTVLRISSTTFSGGSKRDELAQQDIAGAVDESERVVAEDTQAEQARHVDD